MLFLQYSKVLTKTDVRCEDYVYVYHLIIIAKSSQCEILPGNEALSDSNYDCCLELSVHRFLPLIQRATGVGTCVDQLQRSSQNSLLDKTTEESHVTFFIKYSSQSQKEFSDVCITKLYQLRQHSVTNWLRRKTKLLHSHS